MKSIATPIISLFCIVHILISDAQAESIAPFVVNVELEMEVSGNGFGRKTTLTIAGNDQKSIKISKKTEFIKFLKELPDSTLLRCAGFYGPSFEKKKAEDHSGREYEYHDLFWQFCDGKFFLRDIGKYNKTVMTSLSISE